MKYITLCMYITKKCSVKRNEMHSKTAEIERQVVRQEGGADGIIHFMLWWNIYVFVQLFLAKGLFVRE